MCKTYLAGEMEIALRSPASGDRALLKAWVNHPGSPFRRLDAKALARHAPVKGARRPSAKPLARSLFIIERDGAPVGQVSLEKQEGAFALDLFVEPAHRRAGIARAALLSLLDSHGRDHPDATYIARVAAANDAGRGFFSMLGFTFSDQDTRHVTYRRRSVEGDSGTLRSLFGQPADEA